MQENRHCGWSWLVRVTLGCAALASAATATPAISANLDFVLTQRSTRMGDQYIYISPDGWRMMNPHSGVTFVSRGPDWKVTLFNARSNTYYDMTPEQWVREAAAGAGHEEWSAGSHWIKKGKVTVSGVEGTLYEISGVMRKRDASGHIFPRDIVKAKYVVAEGYPINPRLTRMMIDVYGFPSIAGIPLRLTYISDKGEQRPILDTYRIDRSALTASCFNPPTGLRKVDSEMEVMIDAQQLMMLKKMAAQTKPSNPELVNKATQEINKNSYSDRVNPQSGGGQTTKMTADEVKDLLEKYRKQQAGK